MEVEAQGFRLGKPRPTNFLGDFAYLSLPTSQPARGA